MNLIETKNLGRKGSAVLLEYTQDETTKRVIVPAADLKDLEEVNAKITVPEDILDQGIPYGIPWEYMIQPFKISPETLAKNLRSLGIWTYEDAIKSPQAVMDAVFSCTTDLLAQVRQLSKNFRDQI